ncbi:MAG: hypothetical protein Q9165_002047 [Trypethelium subeluteriae]
MSSFFTTPASQKKRKRTDSSRTPLQKRRNVTSTGKSSTRLPPPSKKKQARDESISGSDSEDENSRGARDAASIDGSEESEYENETAAERRLRLAEQYLENVREEVDEVGFDAAEIDRDLIAERLKEDVAETKGKLHKHIADTLDWGRAKTAKMAWGGNASTGIARSKSTDGEHDYLYAVSKDNVIVKWEVPKPFIKAASTRTKFNGEGLASTTSSVDQTPSVNGLNGQAQSTKRTRTPRKLAHFSCRRPPTSIPLAPSVTLHTGKILCVAASPSGKYLATGSSDKRIVIWSVGGSPSELVPIKTFTQHRDAVLALSFRIALGGGTVSAAASRGNISGGANQMFSASADRTIKLWDLDAMTYVETLFGHQDTVVDVAGCAGEKCVSVGSRDRTARFWKVVEENQLVFRGGGVHKARGENVPGTAFSLASKMDGKDEQRPEVKGYAEGSIDRVALIDEETFVTGSDNGSICLWTIHKKKPVFTIPLAHGLDPLITREEALAEDPALIKAGQGAAENWEPPPQEPRWITSLATVPYSDLVISASWDGFIRAWKVSEDKRRIEAMGVVGTVDERSLDANGIGHTMIDEETNGDQRRVNLKEQNLISGIANDVAAFERGERGKDGLYIAVAVGKEHRLGRWKKSGGSNGVIVFEVPFKEKSEDVVINGLSEPQE